MVGEAVAAAAVGLIALWLVLQPLLRPSAPEQPVVEPVDPEETPQGAALAALKEIEFDRETGKLSPADYEFLKAKYTTAALETLRGGNGVTAVRGGVEVGAEVASDDVEAMIAARVRALRSALAATSSDIPPSQVTPRCEFCGPRPEPDAVFCSTCGKELGAGS
jgi:hypothetical protein